MSTESTLNCPACGSTDVAWRVDIRLTKTGRQRRNLNITLNEVETFAELTCDACGRWIREIDADAVATVLNEMHAILRTTAIRKWT